ncbi:MAG: hypothetical protein U0031_19575 [Thermomicrobiales bacterium]
MWVVAAIFVLVASAAIAVAIGWTPRAAPSPPLWDLPKLGGSYSGAAGTYAGFSLTAAIFIAGLDTARTSATFATVFGMMLVAFLVHVTATFIAGSTPNFSQAEDAVAHALMLVQGNMVNSLGVSITWLALVPLTTMIGLASLAEIFVWVQLVMVFSSAAWVAFVAHRLTLANTRACLILPVIGITLPALYRLGAALVWPPLWPSGGALPFTFVALGLAAFAFALHLGLLVNHGHAGSRAWLRRNSHWIALAESQIFAVTVGLIWFTLVLS